MVKNIEKYITYDETKKTYRVRGKFEQNKIDTYAKTLVKAKQIKMKFINDCLKEKKQSCKSFRDCVTFFIEHKEKKYYSEKIVYSTLRHYITTFGYLLPLKGERELTDIDETEWEETLSELQNERAWTNSTYNKCVDSVKALYTYYKLTFNAKSIIKPETDSKERKPFTVEQRKIFLQHAKSEKIDLYTLYCLYFLTGARKSELLALTWNDIDLKNKTIDINKHIIEVSGKEVVKPLTKTKTTRLIPIGNTLVLLFLTQMKKKSTTSKVFNYSLQTAYRRFKAVLKKANLPLNLTIHSCRHTFATTNLSNGASIKDIQKIGGWASTAVLLDIYAHEVDEGMKKITTQDIF